MLIVRGVNDFPSAVRDVVSGFAPEVSGHVVVRPRSSGVNKSRRCGSASSSRATRHPIWCSPTRFASTSRRAGVPDTRRARTGGQLGAQRVQVEAGRAMRKLQSQGVHHITLVGADRQTSIDFWEGVLGMPFVFDQPSLDESESHLYFDPGDGGLITVFTNEERTPDPTRTSTDIGAVHHIAFAVCRRPSGRRREAARRARDQAQRRQGPGLHGSTTSRTRWAPDRARLVPVRAAVRLHACRRAARGA